MIMLKRFCFCMNVHQGTYASALMSLIFIGVSLFKIYIYLVSGKMLSYANFHDIFIVITLVFNTFGLIPIIILFYGIYKKVMVLLIPWMVSHVLLILLRMATVIQVWYFSETVDWNDNENKKLMLWFILMSLITSSLSIYCLLCVITFYQELKEETQAQQANTPGTVTNPEFQPMASSTDTTKFRIGGKSPRLEN